MRTDSFLYVEYADGEREFYDLRTDPFELHNIADRLTRRQLSRLHAELRSARALPWRQGVLESNAREDVDPASDHPDLKATHMKSSLEIAQEHELIPIEDLADRIGLLTRGGRAIRPVQGEDLALRPRPVGAGRRQARVRDRHDADPRRRGQHDDDGQPDRRTRHDSASDPSPACARPRSARCSG